MITLEKYTVEDALKQSFRDDPASIGRLMHSPDGYEFTAIVTQKFTVPVKYAKAILKNYINETVGTEGNAV